MSTKLIAITIVCALWTIVRIVEHISDTDCEEWFFYDAFEAFPNFIAYPLIYLLYFIKCSLLPIFVWLYFFLIFF